MQQCVSWGWRLKTMLDELRKEQATPNQDPLTLRVKATLFWALGHLLLWGPCSKVQCSQGISISILNTGVEVC